MALTRLTNLEKYNSRYATKGYFSGFPFGFGMYLFDKWLNVLGPDDTSVWAYIIMGFLFGILIGVFVGYSGRLSHLTMQEEEGEDLEFLIASITSSKGYTKLSADGIVKYHKKDLFLTTELLEKREPSKIILSGPYIILYEINKSIINYKSTKSQ